MRQQYETPANLELERKAAKIVKGALKCRIFKRNSENFSDPLESKVIEWNLFSLDEAPKLLAIAEFKGRNVRMDSPMIKKGGIFLSKHKYERGLAFAKELGVEFYFFVWCHDGLFGIFLEPGFPIKQNSGRTRQTRDEHDIEACALLPAEKFRLLSDEEKPRITQKTLDKE